MHVFKKIYAAIFELTGSFYLFIYFWWNEFFWRNEGVIFKYLLYWCRKLFEGCFLVVGAGVMKGNLDNLMKDKTDNCNLILSTGHSHETQRRDSKWEGNLKMKVLASIIPYREHEKNNIPMTFFFRNIHFSYWTSMS